MHISLICIMEVDLFAVGKHQQFDILSYLDMQAPKKKLSNKEKKQRAKVRKAQRERGEDVSDTDEDEL